MKATKKISATRLRELVKYDPETGLLTWLQHRWPRYIGTVATMRANTGYIVLNLDRKLYSVHRLAWLYVHGEWPNHEIDHINGNRGDNRLCNLRDVPRSHNNQNRRRPGVNNTSGYLGVTKSESGKWRSMIKANGKRIYLGTHSTPELAYQAYVDAKRQLHPAGQL